MIYLLGITALFLLAAWAIHHATPARPEPTATRRDLREAMTFFGSQIDDIAAAMTVWSNALAPERVQQLLDGRLVCARCDDGRPADRIVNGTSLCATCAHTADRTPVRE